MLLTIPRHSHNPGAAAILAAIETSAILTGVLLQGPKRLGGGWRFRLLPNLQLRPHKYRRYSANTLHPRKDGEPRRVHAVCWHGHRDFMLHLFELLPQATLYTGMSTYRGAKHFHDTYSVTAYRQVGSLFNPVQYVDLCDCENEKES